MSDTTTTSTPVAAEDVKPVVEEVKPAPAVEVKPAPAVEVKPAPVVEEVKPAVVEAKPAVEEAKPAPVVEEAKLAPAVVEAKLAPVDDKVAEEVKAAVKPATRKDVKPEEDKKQPVAVVVVETEVARLLQKLVTDTEPITWSSLPRMVTKAMELVENLYGLNGIQKRQLVIDALTQLVRTVDKEAGISIADPVFQAMLPSLVDHFVTVSKDGLSINVAPPTPAGCFRFLCCK